MAILFNSACRDPFEVAAKLAPQNRWRGVPALGDVERPILWFPWQPRDQPRRVDLADDVQDFEQILADQLACVVRRCAHEQLVEHEPQL